MARPIARLGVVGFVLAGLQLALTILSPGATAWAEVHPEGSTVVDRVVAVVGAAGDRGRDLQIVTEYELEIEAQLVVAERAHSVDIAAGRAFPERLRESVLETVISYLLIESEAVRLQLVALTDTEVEAERRQIEQRTGGEGTLQRFSQLTGAPTDLIDTIIRRRALVSLFIQRNIQLAAPVTDVDIEDAYRRGDHPFGDRPLEEIRSSLEAYLSTTRQRERLRQWLEDARRRNRVWIIPL